MERLILVSNRLPVTIEKRKAGLHVSKSVGGLATGLDSFYKSYDSLWIGWPGVTLERIKGSDREELSAKLAAEKCVPVLLSQRDLERYYFGFSNNTIWPLFHYFLDHVEYEEEMWESYRHANRRFSDVILEHARPDDTIWIHDYQLMLVPQMVRQEMPDVKIGFFLHIPFPSYEVFRLLPWRKELLNGLLGADLIGFHTYDYVRHFLSSISRLLGHEIAFGQFSVGTRIVRVDAFPMGIDYQRYAGAVDLPKVKRTMDNIRRRVGDQRLILSIDRLDYTKGIPHRLEAFDLFLERNPEYLEKVTMIMVAVPSRTNVETYRQLKRQVDELVGKIEGRHGSLGWMPLWYLYRSLPFETLVALYHLAEVALITPVRDGMNLIAKEYIATKTDGKGVLILSEMAGASLELGEALIVNPNDSEEIIDALKEALSMPEEEQKERNQRMKRRLERYNVVRWAGDFMDRLHQVKASQNLLCARVLTPEIRQSLIQSYREAKKRLILLDYDGTLVPFADKPARARPDPEIQTLIGQLCLPPENKVVIISGRDRETLDRWLGNNRLSLIAEHGVWLQEPAGEWEIIEPLASDWKSEIRPIMELYVDRTPGSLLEEKNYSLVWHYRRASPELAAVRVIELKETLRSLTSNLNLGVLEGSKVIEVKNTNVNKGRAALRWLSKDSWDFILAAGDDWTDEDIFAVLPSNAYSVKVGMRPTKARFNVESHLDIRALLKELLETETNEPAGGPG